MLVGYWSDVGRYWLGLRSRVLLGSCVSCVCVHVVAVSVSISVSFCLSVCFFVSIYLIFWSQLFQSLFTALS
jgi:hypothetical protein